MTGLLEPLALRAGLVARNRIVFGPHVTNLGRKRSPSERLLEYYRRRAAGGCGTIILEEASVHPSDWPYERCPLAEDCKEGWGIIAEALHAEGAVALAAIGHAGGQGSSAFVQAPLWAPSRVPEVATREVPKWMEPADIEAVVAGFADATRIAVDAGLDGVEVNAGQFSLIRQFLSGLTNHRDDEYGTDRLRFARQVLAAVRGAASDAVVGLRLSCDELAPWAGIVPEAGADMATALAPGHADFVTVVRGSIYTTWATRPDTHVEPGFNLDTVRLVRAALPPGVAVIAQGSIVDPAMADAAVAEGACDGVEMTRAQIADPDLVAKLAAGTPERVRPCILCNQACQVRDARNPIVSCVGEPSSGHETEDEPVGPTSVKHPTEVLVVGAGPAGLECARVAALRGHRVRVVERRQFGGAVRVAARGAARQRLALLVDWLEAECRTLGVDLDGGRQVTSEEVAALHDRGATVVLCTGGREGELPFPVEEGAVVLGVRDVLGSDGPVGAELPEGPVVVWDPVGGPVAVSVAEALAPSRQVTLVSQDHVIGTLLDRTGDLAPVQGRLHSAGVTLVKRVLVRRLRPDAVEVEDRFGGGRFDVPAAAVVACGHGLPEDGLWRAAGGTMARAGDAVAPRGIHDAVLEGRRAALALDRPRG